MSTGDVYIHPHVQAVIDLYGELVGEAAWTRSCAEQLDRQAERLTDGVRAHHPGARVELSNWHPDLIGADADDIWSSGVDRDGCLDALAREHGYRGADDIASRADRRPDADFEAAVELLLRGDVAGLDAGLTAQPDLVTRRSHWDHRATLLHYAASNGVEIHRQRVPLDLAEVIGVLLDHGAEVNATAHAYGGEQTVLGLLLSSGHPHAAGVTGAARDVLVSAGAR
jgi:hypothetical protein